MSTGQAEGQLRGCEVHQARITELQQRLDAANQRMKELTEQRNVISGHFSHLEMCRDNATVRAEAAERKLAKGITALTAIRDMQINGWNPDETWSRALDMKTYAKEALAQIEQPEPQENFAGLAACRAEQVNSQPVKTNQCKYCNGLGFVSTPDANNVRCPICSGAGNQIEQPQNAPANHISAHPPAPTEEIQELRYEAADWQRQFHSLKAQCETNGFTVRYGDDGMPVLSGADSLFDACQCPAHVAARTELRKEESK